MMNPDKLFDYLDGKLDPAARAELEEQLLHDEHLQKQFAVAREIHRGVGTRRPGAPREVVVASDPDRGARLGRRIFAAAIFLIFLNVIGGLAFIAYKNKKPAAPSPADSSVRQQVEASLGAAAQNAMPMPTFVPAEVQLVAPRLHWDALATRIIEAAGVFGGEATRGLADESSLTVLADIPTSRESEFRTAITSAASIVPPPAIGRGFGPAPAEPDKRTIVQVRIAEAAP